MRARAMSDDNAEQLDQPSFREGRTRKVRPSCVSACFFHPQAQEEIDMTYAPHSFDALMDITARPQAVFVRGKGSYLGDERGKRYPDFSKGWAVNCQRHSP